ncbi:hypothetical protein DRQ18_05985 [bacterium]|nr:MAG: hypothetical protein DRQ18_05985 [bacterium]
MKGKIAILLAFLILMEGCATLTLEAYSVDKPISMTGRLDSQKFKKVATFKKTITSYWLFGGLFPLSQPPLDKALMKEITKYGGDGIIGLKVKETLTFTDILIMWLTGTTVYPRSFQIEGVVVKYTK